MPTTESSTRDQILDAAERLFARQGFDSTTVKQIGAEAEVNSALLYYYFDDKEALYRAMLRRLIAAFVEEGARRIDVHASPESAIRQFVGLQLWMMSAHPHLPHLLVRELIDHDAAHAEEQFRQLAAGLFTRLCDIVRRGQREGTFRTDVDPEFAAISIVAQVAYFSIARPAVGILLGYGADGPPPEVLPQFGEHAAAFALAALRAPATAATAATAATRLKRRVARKDSRGER